MPGRILNVSDFPASATLSVKPPPSSQPPTNVLILLHGLGDTHASFTTFGQRLALPETVCISVRGPRPLPFDLDGFHWGDDIVFDQGSGGMEMDTGFKASTQLVLEDIIRKTLIQKCGYRLREVILFGFGQGGMVALNVAAQLGTEELGGVVSIGGILPLGAPLPSIDQKFRTPVLVCKGNRNSAVTSSAIQRLKDMFEFVEVKEWKKTGDGMPASREEMLPIMQFFARRLRSVRGVPEGSIEIT